MRGRPRVRSIIPQRARSKGATERVIPDKLGEKKADTPAAGYLGGDCLFSVKQPVPPIPTRMAGSMRRRRSDMDHALHCA
jgi:hypothetical protein